MEDQKNSQEEDSKQEVENADVPLNKSIEQNDDQLPIEKQETTFVDIKTGQSDSDDDLNESKKLGKLSPKAKIESITKGFSEMIDYMDFSFEMAF